MGSELESFARARRWKGYLKSEIRPFIGPRVAEVGAGIGTMTSVLADVPALFWLAIEPDRHLAEQIPRAPRMRVFVGRLSDLPAGELFDSILYVDVVEHIHDDAAELEHASAHLLPGGRLIVLVPAHNFLFTPFDAAIGHFRRYNKRMLLRAVPRDLHLRRLRYLDSVGMLASLANKLVLRQAAANPGQIRLWDGYMVPISKVLDPLLGFTLGKSLLGVWSK